jgi:hypothetical protein
MPQSKQQLYSVACERYIPNGRHGRWEPSLEYLHAEDAGHARAQFCTANPNRRICKIIAIGPVIGYTCDDNGNNISV